MSSKKKKNILIYLGKAILIALLIVFVVRTFLVESYTISSVQMQTALLEDDRVIVNKAAYGVRFPITVLSIPFVFDNLFGIQSYSSSVQLPYYRIFSTTPHTNDIVLFNNPLESDKPIDKRMLLVSRCVALPGESIEVKDGVLFINDTSYVLSPDFMTEYKFRISDAKEIVDEILQDEDIPLRNYRSVGDTAFIHLNKYEVYILNQNLVDSIRLIASMPLKDESYKIKIPAKGMVIELTESNISIYQQTIVQEQQNKARISNNKLLIDGREQARYKFQEDYCWMLSDNSIYSLDSRSLGFIPFSHIIGKVGYVWYRSQGKDNADNRHF